MLHMICMHICIGVVYPTSFLELKTLQGHLCNFVCTEMALLKHNRGWLTLKKNTLCSSLFLLGNLIKESFKTPPVRKYISRDFKLFASEELGSKLSPANGRMELQKETLSKAITRAMRSKLSDNAPEMMHSIIQIKMKHKKC